VVALVVSALIAGYLLIPYAYFRFLLGLSVPLKVFEQRRTEDLTRAVVTLVLIFGCALLTVWYLPFFKDHPLGFPDTPALRYSDYVTVASGLYSESLFKEYGQRFWDALARTLYRQGRFAAWYFLLVTVVARFAGFLSKRYGRFRKYKLYSKFADVYLLPHLSQWHVLLKPFAFPDPKNTIVRADILMSDNTLYRGEVVDHFQDKDGNLSGIFLGNPVRFDRKTYLNEKERWGVVRPTSVFWREIPSAKLYLFADKIVNLNLNYEPPTAIPEVIERYVSQLQKGRPISVVITHATGTAIGESKPAATGTGSHPRQG